MKVQYRGSNRDLSNIPSPSQQVSFNQFLLSPAGSCDRWGAACWRAPVWVERSTRRSAPTAASPTQRWARLVVAARRGGPASAHEWWPSSATAAAAALHRSAAPVSGDCISRQLCVMWMWQSAPPTYDGDITLLYTYNVNIESIGMERICSGSLLWPLTTFLLIHFQYKFSVRGHIGFDNLY